MGKENCTGKTAQDCEACRRWYSYHSSHYDSYYDCHIVEFTCCIGGHRIFKDEDNDIRQLNGGYMNYLKHLCINWKVAGHCLLDFLEHFLHGLIPLIKWEHENKY